MMKLKTTAALTLTGVLMAPTVFSQPTSGAYVNDLVNSYVQDDGMSTISTVNNIMCFMGKLRPEQMVGAGNYKALVDKIKCNKSGSENTAAGASSQVEYINTVVNSTRASTTDPMNVNAWVLMNADPMFPNTQTIYTNTTVSAGASATAPNGAFTMSFGSYPDNTPNTLAQKGTINASASTITFYEEGTFGGGYSTALTLTQSGTDSGSGRTQTSQNGGIDSTFAYNSTHFKREKTGQTAQCFSRSAAQADVSTWRYGVYNADGSRLDLANPGFNVTYTNAGNLYYGYAGFYGVYFPDAALQALTNGATLSRPGSANTYTYNKVGGKLTKLTKVATNLGSLKGMPLRVWDTTGTGQEWEVVWNGTNVVRTRTINCSTGTCVSTSDGSTTFSAANMLAAGTRVVQGWSDAVGGPVLVKVPTAGEFSNATEVYYRTRTTVAPAAADALNLVCVSQCLKGTTNLSLALPNSSSPYETVGASSFNFGPVTVASAKTYDFNASGMMYLTTDDASGRVDASSFASTGGGAKLTGPYQWGLRTGSMVASSDVSVRCSDSGGGNYQQNDAGTHYCPHLIFQANEVYEWETGNKPWNQYAGLTLNGVGGGAVTFDPPKRLSVTLSTTNSTLLAGDNKLGSSVLLSYNGFGDLHGIPGSCYNKETNAKTTCGTNTGYAPDFSLKAGATVSDGSTTYYVKPIDQELRFAKVADVNCAGLVLPTTATLPNTATDPKALIGALPTIADSVAPAVIHGVVQ